LFASAFPLGDKMSIMPRINNKATKIAYKILGVPANMRTKPTEQEKQINKRLVQEETMRVR
jgi:hypothetical protein